MVQIVLLPSVCACEAYPKTTSLPKKDGLKQSKGMKKFFKIVGVFFAILAIGVTFYFFVSHEALPKGVSGEKADQLAHKMMAAMNKKAFDATEVLEWNFGGIHQYRWKKKEGLVEVSWSDKKVTLNLNDTSKSKGESSETIQKALDFFNNDSFWLVAPYKVFDQGVERSIVNYQGKEALLVKHTMGGTIPGDSYLWILDTTYTPTSFKMWTKAIPLGGVSATWNHFTTAASGIRLPTMHTLSLLNIQIVMSGVKAYNPDADLLARNILKAVKHDAYKKTRYIEWSFRGKRFYKWDKQAHSIDVSWDDIRVVLKPNQLKKSRVYLKEKEVAYDERLVEKALRLFNNDSFWLVAPHKLFEPGIYRSIEFIDGKEALRVKYSIGGTTPGDSYVWILDQNYVPKSYRMYVPSMNMAGVPATWEDWTETASGTLLPKNHTLSSGRTLSMGHVKAYNN